MLPPFLRVRQHFLKNSLADPLGTLQAKLDGFDWGAGLKRGDRVAITAGSRGIANIAGITATLVAALRAKGAKPFVVPAMGSHGGATAEGQTQMLAKLGMTPESLGCEILSSMETVEVCQAAQGFPVLIDRLAWEADHLVICNRIKPHTGIRGDLESGLVKMMLIGLGKHEGAKIYHRAMADFSFGAIASGVAEQVVQRCRVLAGVGIVENGYDETALIEVIPGRQIVTAEKRLLEHAKAWIAKLPFEALDLLLVDQMGKNLSGTGMDTNVVGRKSNDNAAMPGETPNIKRICVRALTPQSAGNAQGIGIAEFCRSQIIRELDRKAMAINAITSLHPTAAMLPIDFETDREMLETAGSTIGLTPLERSRTVWIPDTLHLTELECSLALLPEIEAQSHLEIIAGPRTVDYLDDENLPWFADIPRGE